MKRAGIDPRMRDKNQIILAVLCGMCLVLTIAIFVRTNGIHTGKKTERPVLAADVMEAYAFLQQEEAVAYAAAELNEPCTYGAYQTFLETLHLWTAAGLSEVLDWEGQKQDALSQEALELTRMQVEELFDRLVPESGAEEYAAAPEETKVKLSAIDETTCVRVLLLQDGAACTKQLYISASAPYTLTFHEKTKTKKKAQIIRASQLKLAVGESAAAACEDGQLYLADKDGSRKTLGYNGTFRITRYADGYAVVNEVAIEDYLCGVVQSEMPAYFEKEALKAQTVCARTYILTQLQQDNYPQYGADVDDSVRFQAYNQSAPDTRILEAVDEACGMVLTYDGYPAQTYFFSTSYGVTGSRELWELSNLDYLKPVRGNAKETWTDLSDEQAFRAQLAKQEKTDYDFASSYYRWQATLNTTDETYTKNAQVLLEKLRQTQPESVTVRASGGKDLALADFGKIKKIKVAVRGSSGAVRRLRLVFQKGTVELSNENYIRQVLGQWMQVLTDKNGGALSATGAMLPSAYFYVQTEKDGITLFGGGLGHGIGMSQYGANAMAQTGRQMEEILQTYYPGTTLTELYHEE